MHRDPLGIGTRTRCSLDCDADLAHSAGIFVMIDLMSSYDQTLLGSFELMPQLHTPPILERFETLYYYRTVFLG